MQFQARNSLSGNTAEGDIIFLLHLQGSELQIGNKMVATPNGLVACGGSFPVGKFYTYNEVISDTDFDNAEFLNVGPYVV